MASYHTWVRRLFILSAVYAYYDQTGNFLAGVRLLRRTRTRSAMFWEEDWSSLEIRSEIGDSEIILSIVVFLFSGLASAFRGPGVGEVE